MLQSGLAALNHLILKGYPPMRDNALAYAHSHHPETLSALQELLRIPSISTLSEHAADLNQAAKWLKNKLVKRNSKGILLISVSMYQRIIARDYSLDRIY